MRQTIEQLIASYEQARQARAATDRAAEPRAWAQADLDYTEALGQLTGEVRDAARRLGMIRELNRALGGTGLAVARFVFDPDSIHLMVEIEGRPATPAERRTAALPATADRVRAVTDDFYSRTGLELAFPYDRLGEKT